MNQATSRALPKFESYAAFETAGFFGIEVQTAIERFHGIGRLGCWQLGVDTGQQHPDKEECHCRQRKIDNFGCEISKNIARRHDESPYNRSVSNRLVATCGIAWWNLR
jgi:hypothetical protein